MAEGQQWQIGDRALVFGKLPAIVGYYCKEPTPNEELSFWYIGGGPFTWNWPINSEARYVDKEEWSKLKFKREPFEMTELE